MKVFPSVCCVGMLGLCMPGLADVVVVPAEYELMPGNTSRNTQLRDQERSMQFIIAASELAGVPAGTGLTGVTWRLRTAAPSPWPPVDVTWFRYDIEVATSLNPPSSASLTYAENIGGDNVMVRSGALTIPTGTFASGSSPNPFGYVIPFDVPFVYQGGDLVITIRHGGNGASNEFSDSVSSAVTGWGTRFFYLDNTTADALTGLNRSMFPIMQISTGATVQPCYADCDGNEVLNIDDFLCFINEFAQAQTLPVSQQITHYANCTGSTLAPVLTIDDFLCFINEFAQGCP